MQSFHNDKKVKVLYLNRVAAHEKADEIIKGQYWSNGKGCAVGCTIHSSSHVAYETELGIPRILARLEDGIFENLPNALAQTWPRRFLAATPIGVDLSSVWPKFAVWMLTDEKYGVINVAKTVQQKEAIQAVSDLYLFKLEGVNIDSADWLDARNDAAYAADAADAAAADAADAAKREGWRIVQSEKLLELLRASGK